MVASVIIIITLLGLLIGQHVVHQRVLEVKAVGDAMAIERIYDTLTNEWIRGNISSQVYHPLIIEVENASARFEAKDSV